MSSGYKQVIVIIILTNQKSHHDKQPTEMGKANTYQQILFIYDWVSKLRISQKSFLLILRILFEMYYKSSDQGKRQTLNCVYDYFIMSRTSEEDPFARANFKPWVTSMTFSSQ